MMRLDNSVKSFYLIVSYSEEGDDVKSKKIIYYMTSDNVFSNWPMSLVTFFDKMFYYMTSDNVFSEWLTSLLMFFDKTLYSPRTSEYNIYSPDVT